MEAGTQKAARNFGSKEGRHDRHGRAVRQSAKQRIQDHERCAKNYRLDHRDHRVGACCPQCDRACRGESWPSEAPSRRGDGGVKRPITESNDFIGRIESPNRVNEVARVTAFLEKRHYIEGSEVKAGDLLYQLERCRCRNQSRGCRHCDFRWYACREFNTHFPGANALCGLQRWREAAVGRHGGTLVGWPLVAGWTHAVRVDWRCWPETRGRASKQRELESQRS